MNATFPDLEALLEPLLGLPYAEYDCWALCRRLYKDGWGEDLDASPAHAWKRVEEVWWRDDETDPLTVVQPWDLWIQRGLGMASQHTGIIINDRQFIHTRERIGVCLEPMIRWRPRLLQIARLRRLL